MEDGKQIIIAKDIYVQESLKKNTRSHKLSRYLKPNCKALALYTDINNIENFARSRNQSGCSIRRIPPARAPRKKLSADIVTK